MKVAFSGVELEAGKRKYKDPRIDLLVEKYAPLKVTPFYFDFIPNAFAEADCLVVDKHAFLDLLLQDMEKIETRLGNAREDSERQILKRFLVHLEGEVPLCDGEWDSEELLSLRELAPITFRPTLIINGEFDEAQLHKDALKKSKTIFFYTAGKKEVRAWPVKAGSSAVECAGKIHSDLARGFIKAEVTSFEDLMQVHNLNEAKSKGLTRLEDRDYAMQDGDVIEIRFNV